MHTLHASLIPSPSRRHPPSKESIKKKGNQPGKKQNTHAHPKCQRCRPLHRNSATQDHSHNLRKGGKEIHTTREEVWAGGRRIANYHPKFLRHCPDQPLAQPAAHLHLKTKEKEREAGAGGKGAIIYTADTLRSFRELLPRHRRSKERTRGTGPKERERARQLFWKRKTTHAAGESSQFTVW